MPAIKHTKMLNHCRDKYVVLIFKLLVVQSQSSESVPSRAVAKKSTTKRPDCITDRMQEEQQQTYQGNIEKIQQPQGHIEVCQCTSISFVPVSSSVRNRW